MRIEPGFSSPSKPEGISTTAVTMDPGKETVFLAGTHSQGYYLSSTSKSSNPELIHPSDLQELEKPNPSMPNLLVNSLSQLEENKKNEINFLYQRQAKLTQDMIEAKKKLIEFHNSSNATINLCQPVIDIVLPFCTALLALYLGFSPEYSLSKIPAIGTSVVGFAIAGLKMADVQVPNHIPHLYMAIFNLYMAYINTDNTLLYITTFLQTFPMISEFAYAIDNNSICSDEALMQKVIKNIEQDLKNVTAAISRTMKTIAGQKKFFSITTDYTQLQNKIAAIGAV